MKALHAIGIDFGGTKIEVIVLDGSGAEIWRKRVATPAGYVDRVGTAKTLVESAERELSIHGASVGVGAPGTATADGRIKNSNSVCLNGMPLAADLAAALGRPVRVANDANCLALSEATDGAAAGAGVVFAAILGTGVGAGIVVHGRLLEGPNGLAGEWGHNPLPWADAAEAAAAPACYCGQRGCIETWLSGPGLAADHAHHAASSLAGPDIVRRAEAGDAACAATLERHASRVARALAHVINLLDPDVIVLGGGLSRIASLYQRVPALWDGFVFSGGVREPVRTRLVPAAHGDSSGVRGAAWLFR
jgi:fructokinase